MPGYSTFIFLSQAQSGGNGSGGNGSSSSSSGGNTSSSASAARTSPFWVAEEAKINRGSCIYTIASAQLAKTSRMARAHPTYLATRLLADELKEIPLLNRLPRATYPPRLHI